ncbi:hypothetical protein D3C78_1302670 [compost metagenome]
MEALELAQLGRQALLADQQNGRLAGFVDVAHQLHRAALHQVVHLVDDQRAAAGGQFLGHLVGHLGNGRCRLDVHLGQDGLEEVLLGPDAAGLHVVGTAGVGNPGGGHGLAVAARTVEAHQPGQAGGARQGPLQGDVAQAEVGDLGEARADDGEVQTAHTQFLVSTAVDCGLTLGAAGRRIPCSAGTARTSAEPCAPRSPRRPRCAHAARTTGDSAGWGFPAG